MDIYLHLFGEDPLQQVIRLQEQETRSRINFVVADYVKVLITQGHGRLCDEISGEKFDLTPGSLIQRRPGMKHTQHFSKDCRQVFILGPAVVYDLVHNALGDFPACVQVADVDQQLGLWMGFADEFRNKSYSEALLALPALMAQPLRPQKERSWLEIARGMLGTGMLSPEDVAEELGMSYVSFRTRFRCEEGLAPAAYRRRHQIARACHLLQETNMTVTTISQSLGYRDIFSFSRQFRREVGSSPQQWRADM
ncbi:MAG: helix-turn-helix transcriptional regulator [Lentisphaeraceae bacterium]|nr:helix-turn-helix transcriptional regulator [Lentisphaeraceae bacterium]